MHRRDSFIRPAQPPRRRRGRHAIVAVAGAMVLAATGALTATAAPFGHGPLHHHRGGYRWALPAATFDRFTARSSRPRSVETTGITSSAPVLATSPSSASASASDPATSSATPSASTSASGTASASASTSNGVTYGTPDHLFAASSPWNTPIASDAAVDSNSSAIVSKVLDNSGLVVNLDLISFGQPFYTASASTPKVTLGGGSEIGAVPIDPSWTPNSGSDAKMNIIDPTTQTIYELQGYNAAAHTARWAVKHDYATALGDGYPSNGELVGPTGSGMSQAAGTIRASDLASGSIDHALSFITSSPIAGFRYPASHSDGSGSGIGIQEGMRIQLDPSVDVDAIPGLTSGERMIAKALQTYGAYCSDSGGGNNQAMGIYVEKPTSATQSIYTAAGLTNDWQVLNKLPRDKLRVLAASATVQP